MTDESLMGRARQKLRILPHRLRLFLMGLTRGKAYREYLRDQLWRTWSRKHFPLGRHTRILVDRVLACDAVDSKSKVLCVGCRNTAEIEYFRQKGIPDVMGIDLYSDSPLIRVMDMHDMKFKDSEFDVVYSSHSLEHSKDVSRVIKEIVRVVRPGGVVAIEVPVRYSKTDTDLVDFKSLDRLHAAFGPAFGRALWTDEQAGDDENNEQGTDVIRTIFTVSKP